MEIVLLIIGLIVGYVVAYFIGKGKFDSKLNAVKEELIQAERITSSSVDECEQQRDQLMMQYKDQAKITVATISRVLDESADSSDTTSQALSDVTNQIKTLTAMVGMIIDLSTSAGKIADLGMVNVDAVVTDLSDLAKSKSDLAMILEKFNEVQEKTKAIRYIGEEAEMLALNAAIEAARAGDAGRGFAVVADSMKSLAKNSQNTTHEILAIVQESNRVISEVAESFSDRGEKLDTSISGLVKNFTQINISVSTIKAHSKMITSDSEGISALMTKSSSITKTSVENLVKQLSEITSGITGKKVIDLTPNEARDQWDSFDEIIDVRRAEEWESELGYIDGIRLSTLQTDFKKDVNKLDKSKRYLFVCRSGGRSTKAAQMAIAKGIEQVCNLAGGMLEWRTQGLEISRKRPEQTQISD
ncbi:MAG: hypothetical protein COA86_08100 [Kangiella sp.]|nr:MAG: hypothetical protein COA86_08100 [Kangiella sp.]